MESEKAAGELRPGASGLIKRSIAISVAIMLGMVAVFGSGALSFTVEAASLVKSADIDIELVPTYREVTYTLDAIETLQRWDAQGDWT